MKIKQGLVSREFLVERAAVDFEGRRVPLSFSSDSRVLRTPWFGEPFYEVLGHDSGEIMGERAQAAMPVRDEHYGPQVGVARDVKFAAGRGTAVAEFSKNRTAADELLADVRDGIRPNVSVAYRVLEYRREPKADGETYPTYRATKWEPVHIAFVGEPADISVGVGRSAEGAEVREVRVIDAGSTGEAGGDAGDTRGGTVETKESETMKRKMRGPFFKPDDGRGGAGTETPGTPRLEVVDDKRAIEQARNEARSEAAKSEKDRVAAIYLVKRNVAGNIPEVADMADKAVEEGRSAEEFYRSVCELVGKRNVKIHPETTDTGAAERAGIGEKDLKEYNLLRGAVAFSKNQRSFEVEVHEALVKTQRPNEVRGMLVPHEVFGSVLSKEERATVTTSGSGTGLVGTELVASAFIDALRARTILGRLGITMLPGLVGNVDIPRLAAGATVYWVTEGNGPTEDPSTTFDTVSMTPHTVAAKVPVTRRMLLQSTPGVEAIVRNDIVNNLLIGIEVAGFNGSGNAPTGLLQQAIGAGPSLGANGGAVNWKTCVDLETTVASANADVGRLAYATNPKVRGQAKQTLKGTAVDRFIWDTTAMDAPLNGYNCEVSNTVPSNLTKGASIGILSALIFGNWSDFMLGTWGVVDLIPDPWTNVDSGGLIMRVFQDCDVALRHLTSFAASEEINTTL